ncbi:MAG: SIMPL domain-containing protein [Chloroflexota bacterium]
MKKKLGIIGLLLTSVLIAGLAAGCDNFAPPSAPKAAVSGVVFSQQNTGIWVSGEGRVTAAPDIAVLSLGVQAQTATVASAQQQAAAAMDAVMKALTGQGVARKDIQTQQYIITPVRHYDPNTQQQILDGYRVSNTVTAKIRNVTDTGIIIDDVTAAGGDDTIINSIDFTVEDPTPYLTEARDKAMADARAKAEQLAKQGGVRLGRPTYINESGGNLPVPIQKLAVPAPMPAGAPTTPISPGELDITLTVQVVYSIE